MKISYQQRLLILVVILAVFVSAGSYIKKLLLPDSFGAYGPYRADAITEETLMPVRHGTNFSCFKCHPYEAKVHKAGRHRTISCEFCHGPYADHADNGKKIGTLPVKKKDQIITLCLRCHNTEIRARPHEVIKTVAMPDHLKAQKVKVTHTCNQCHHVHAPLKYIIRAKQIMGLMEAGS